MLIDKLQALDKIFKDQQAPVLNFFNEGVKLSSSLSSFGMPLESCWPDITVLYGWHNGINLKKRYGVRQTIVELLPMGTMFEFEEALSIRAEMITEKIELLVGDPGEYLPIMGSGENDIHLLNLINGQIYYYSDKEFADGRSEFRSLERMFEFILECHQEQIFSIDKSYGLEIDSDKYFNKLRSESILE